MSDKDNPAPLKKAPASEASSGLLEALLKDAPKIADISESRVDVIVTVAQIEANLTTALLSTLAPSMDEREDDLFDDSRPLGSFMLKAKLCVRLGIVSPTLFKALSVLSHIRNRCAHEHKKDFDIFSDGPSVDKISYVFGQINPQFKTKKKYSTKEMFNLICGLTNAYFVLYSPLADGKTVFHENELIFKKS
ncbi:MAG: hypothetical protein M3Q70_01675 [bacterium]|nr:hypothetical protein [bacterium]